MLEKFWSKVSAKDAARKRQRIDSYDGLKVILADGGEPDADELLDVLEGVGKTKEDLKTDVDLLLESRKCRVQAAKEPALRETHGQQYKAIEDEEQRFKIAQRAALDQHHKTMTDRRAALAETLAEIDRCQTARNRLLEITGASREIAKISQAIAEPLQQIQSGELGRDYRESLSVVNAMKAKLASMRDRQDGDTIGNQFPSTYGNPIAAVQQELRQAQARLARFQEEVDRNKAVAAEAQERAKQVEAEALATV